MILVDEEIKEVIASGDVGLSDFSEDCLQPASYDLRVGEEGFTVSTGRVNIESEGALVIQPGDFALVMVHEKLRLPLDMLGRFGLRSAFARTGLLATAGPQVDPGFEGKLVIGIVNFSSQPIRLPHLQPFCTLELERLRRPARKPYSGPYQGQEHLTDEIISGAPREQFPLAVMLVRQLVAASPTLREGMATFHRPEELPRDRLAFDREKRAFEGLRPKLLKTHRGKYIVVRKGKRVLSGDNKTELAKQAYARFGYGPLYIGLAEEQPEVVYVPAPRVWRQMR